jgi:cytochrome b pre-mRNA-processing protein 3
MIFNMFRKSTAPDAVHEAYRAIVAQSRREVFYAQWDVPDTVTGRFDMISLHLALFLRRLKDDAAARPFAQAVVERFFRDMDHSIRELGVTDLGVPRKVKTMGKLFYGLAESISRALDSGSASEVEATLVRNIYGGESKPGAARLAAYVVDEAARLAAIPTPEHAPSGLPA